MKNFFSMLGELRTFMLFLTLFSLSAIPFTSEEVRMDDWGLLPDVLVPVVSFILVFILLLDMLMSRVFMIEADDETRARFKKILLLELIQILLLIGLWAPYFISVMY